MSSSIIIGGLVLLILILLIAGAPIKPLRYLANGCVKLVIGVLLLFFLNAFGSSFGLHIPINLGTALVSGFLGIPGILSLVAIGWWII
ncbi:pro-sigmaK processing inhibitor BofA [Pontibacillus halophilus JSM 076056 = DSM 19796]|uniref:Pro-sigmaK processing inhibitor BofA n=1 Tax=Pontibacillus halophilus JSM 076056 = DSM 19796 TaxID=1385510 RepID=A0A0A5ICS0_9BACI|nr:pro-sigmaK processing inhibitor BofA family protein [Pontibacillus halophilus]KGX93642.1 pro-sigmaK processing inhibitor BofA [Pontibacillus halophilus JSM 076056 = DSM 19796]